MSQNTFRPDRCGCSLEMTRPISDQGWDVPTAISLPGVELGLHLSFTTVGGQLA